MLRKTFSFVALCVVLAVAANQVAAATVNLELIYNPTAVGCNGCTLSGAGTYQLFASASAGDNQGIAGYGISVQNVSSLLHRAPRVNSSETPDGDIFPAGFTLLRSANNAVASGTGFLFGAGQDTVSPTPYIIHGFGQTASSVAAEIPAENTNGGIIQPEWGAKLLLAEGMFSGATPDVDLNNVDVFVNLFGPVGGPDIVVADLAKQICDGSCVMTGNPPVFNDFTDSAALNEVIATTIAKVSGDDPITLGALTNFVYTPGFGAVPSPTGIDKQPTWNPATGAFSFDTSGSSRGTYAWDVTATNAAGEDTFKISVDVPFVPEPSTLALFGLAFAGAAGMSRRRS